MCVLAIANAGAEFTRDTLSAMFYANDDGAGWAYAKDGKIYFSKGYTNVNKFIKAVLKLPVDCERMVHCRIATHGGISKPLTHPFPVSRDYRKMEMLNGVLSSGYILAHNGILSNFSPAQNHSDTEELVRCLANVKCDLMGEDMREIINTLIAGSRVAILNTDGKINRYGTGWTQIDGIWFSNTNFKYYMNNYCTRAYNWDDWDDWDTYNGRTYSAYTKSADDKLPAIDDLYPLPEGEVFMNIKTKKAYQNKVGGAYLVDYESCKLYGSYRGTLWTTDFKLCEDYNCGACDYDCPFKKGGA